MNLDEDAAAFGLFHLAFANLAQQLAAAVFYIRRTNQQSLKFEDVFGKLRGFSKLCDALKTELKQFEGRSSTDMEVQHIRYICSKMGPLNVWRRAHTHPRVRIDESGFTIYDWQTRKRLRIDRDECLRKIQEAVSLGVELDQYVGSLLRQISSEKDVDKRVEEMLVEVLTATEFESE
jgi:hypothetical protein